MSQALYLQYAKVVKSKTANNISKRSNHQVPDKLGPHTRMYYMNMCEVLTFSGNYGTALLYGVRIAEFYILSINGKSQIFDSNKSLYNFLVKEHIISDTAELREEFKDFKFINFFRISLLTDCKLSERKGAFPLVVNEKDIHIKYLHDSISFVARIPCLHEDKEVIFVFISTSFLTDEIVKKLHNAEMLEFKSAFCLPSKVIDELMEGLSLNF